MPLTENEETLIGFGTIVRPFDSLTFNNETKKYALRDPQSMRQLLKGA